MLDACLLRRPDDVAVWRAKLKLALATNQLPKVREAIEHLPADDADPAQIYRLTAWIARRQGALAIERRALEHLIEIAPADVGAFARLSELAEKMDQAEQVPELSRQKNEIARLQARYHELHSRNQPIRDAVELARLATRLGLGFEARAYLTIAVSANPRRSDLRDELNQRNRRPSSTTSSSRTIAQAIAIQLN